MKKWLCAFTVLLCIFSAYGCSKNNDTKDIASFDDIVSNAQDNQDNSNSSQLSDVITPEEGSAEYDLGSYRISPSGIKLYYDDDIPSEIMLALEKYFVSFAERDFDIYKTCLYSGYADEMENYLQNDFGYGLEDSFELQCDNLVSMAGDTDFTITRIRAERSDEDGVESFFEVLNDSFNKDYYTEISNDCDGFDDLYFSIIASDGEEEFLIISDFEIVFALKDGQYYTFG